MSRALPRLLAASLSLLSLSLLPLQPARAQNYTGSASGGQYVTRDQSGNIVTLHDSISGANVSANGGGCPTPSCTGGLTITFAWPSGQGTPPQQVIVTQTSHSAWNAIGSGFSGSCADGLGDRENDYPISGPPNGSGEGGNSLGTHYSVMAGGQTVTLYPTPTASASTSVSSAGASISYSASVYPVTITLTGTTPVSGVQEALTGQQITATLNFNGAPVQKVNSYSFTTGGNTFKTWDPTAPNSTHTTQLVPLSSGDLTGSNAAPTPGPSVAFYDETNNDKVIVSCTATVTFTDGTTKTVTATSQPVTFLKPTAVWIVNGPDNVGVLQPGFQHDTENIPAHYMGVVEDWGPVTIALSSLPASLASIGGTGGFGQVINSLSGYTTRSNGTTSYFGSQINGNTNSIGQPVYLIPPPVPSLDTAFPYGTSSQDPTNDTWAATSTEAYVGDDPDQPYILNGDTTGSASGAGTETPGRTGTDDFQTWLMYKPTSGIWVPLQDISWSWSATAILNTSTGNWSFTDTFKSPTSASDSAGMGANTDTPPTWNNVITSSAMLP